ncbi:capreomycidine synthase [Cytobacillus horneckiae]|uniref:capreomycidine synthase n=1 Tax=Cytobacillus horneckiae TaxID=549687 RepID=UPI0019CF8487|nr:capreomycidine synthase [Cytobacillus horneckiae]MBN6889308.1 capreomycidine synthase [Cytobacillus horneckiae]
MAYSQALLEEWMREFYYDANIDIGSSGVHPWSFGEIRNMLNISTKDLDRLVMMDSTSYGDLHLRLAIANRWGNSDPNSVMVTHGSSEAIYLALNSLLEHGDEVVVLDPCYHSLESIAEEIGCTFKKWQLREEEGFKANIENLRKIVSNNTKMVILNFPHNPTGVTIEESELFQIIDLISKYDAYLLWDGAFSELVYNSDPLPDPTIHYKKAISTGTFSKCYGLPGLRFGWCLADQKILSKFIPLRDRLTLHLSPLIEFIALESIKNIDLLIHARKEEAIQNLSYLSKWMETNNEFIEWSPPLGGVTVFPKFKDVNVDLMCRNLGKDFNVLLVPGSCFGNKSRVRLGFGCKTEDLQKGLEILGNYINSKEFSKCIL